MALASYADPNNEFYKLLKEEVVKFQGDGDFELNLSYFKGFLHDQPNLYTERLVETFGRARERDEEFQERHFEIASALQKISEEGIVHLLNWLFQQTREKNLVLSGGLFMNSVFNGKLKNFLLLIMYGYLLVLTIAVNQLVQHFTCTTIF